MRHSSILLALSAASATVAAPAFTKRANFDALPGGDIAILNYALTLEFLERKFYTEGLANYTAADFKAAGFTDDFYTNLKTIASDEASHVTLLSGALGSAAVAEPTFAFPSTDAASFVGLAAVLEGVGVSAYLGAAAVIADKAYVPVAGSILTVEARHSAYVRAALGQKPFPRAYDTPLDFRQVFSLAAQFVTGGVDADKLPLKPFPKLEVMASKTPVPIAGDVEIVFKGAYKNAMEMPAMQKRDHLDEVYAVFFSGLDVFYAKVEVKGDDWVCDMYAAGCAFTGDDGKEPPSGQVYVVLSTADGKSTKVSDENTLSGVGILEFA